MNEAETRAEHIDPALKAAGWGEVEDSRIRREYPITLVRIEGNGKRGKALTADHVLEYLRMEELAYQRWEGERIAEEQFFYDPAQRQPSGAAKPSSP